ncbi:putative TIM-barrel fold metal-dependent hydrolase [Paraburkholderia sp. RAU2J]|uniref:amidohydrolase family protein n=1 Tax=Paraburkholderia sp. RAU2J TaxID=1938810 RepID=UPI000EABBDBD|nr:amidohydrolase family protein [Paraburkholderia sp. RAU2J]RKT13484.1 putative TIM-barrel fold metal-dependent hydrolase [Paraburkholderia sp. RAU2J]
MMEKQGSDASQTLAVHRRPRIASIDAHAHVFEYGLPLARQRRYVPDYDAPLDTYLAQLDEHGVSHAVLVQPSFLGTDCGYLLDALRRAPERLRGVAVIEPHCGLDTLTAMARAGIVGIRLNPIGQAGLPLHRWVSAQTLAHIRELGWHVEVHAEAARLERIVRPLLDEGVNVVVDHFGRPDPVQGIDDPGFRRLLELGNSQRVWVKVSAAYRSWQNSRHDYDDVDEAIQLLKTAFSVKRLMWGSDWPHTQFETRVNFNRTLRLLHAIFPARNERRAIFVDTPAKLYRFDLM